MTKAQNIKAILECNFAGFKEEIIDIAVSCIMSLDQEPCEDAISRQAVLDAMSDTWKHICFVARHSKPTKGEEAVYSDMVGTVKNLPPVNPQEPKTGRWINRHIIANKSIDMIVCSECGEEFSYDAETGISEYNYCPNCGARMESEATSGESYNGEFEAMEYNGRMDAVESDHD